MSESKHHDHPQRSLSVIDVHRRWKKPSRIRKRFLSYALKHPWLCSGTGLAVIIATIICLPTLIASFMYLDVIRFMIALPYLAGMFGLISTFPFASQPSDYHNYQNLGSFTGYCTLGDHEYLVSTEPCDRLADIISIPADVIEHWPHWHDEVSWGLHLYAMHDGYGRPEDIEYIQREYLHSMMHPEEDKSKHSAMPLSLSALQNDEVTSFTDTLIFTRQILDQTASMMDDLGLSHEDSIAPLRHTLNDLQDHVRQYRSDHTTIKLDQIIDEINNLRQSVTALHDDVERLHHDITITQDSSQSIDQLRYKIARLQHQVSSSVAE